MTIYTQLLNAIKAAVKTNLSEIKTIELQRNQLENTSKEKPIILPAIYVDFSDFSWQDYNGQIQKSEATITLQLAVESITTSDEALFLLAQKIFETFENKEIDKKITSRMLRSATRNINEYNAVKIFEIDFICEIFDISINRKENSVSAIFDLHSSY